MNKRYLAGIVEDKLRQSMSDRTYWRAMLKGCIETLDLVSIAKQTLATYQPFLEQLQQQYGIQAIKQLHAEPVCLNYPVLTYPAKISAHNLDKTPHIKGHLVGMKGQYLLLDSGVINIRKFSGYQIKVTFFH